MTDNRSSPKKAGAILSIVALCGAIAYFSIPSMNNKSSFSSVIVNVDINSLSPLQLASLPDDTSFTTTNTNNLRDNSSPPNHGRRLSVALPNGGCEITWPKKPEPGTQIAYAASYPGCGARMTWNLVEALTGLETGDDWNNNGRGEEVVTVKTHYPQSNGILVPFDEKLTRGFIVIRNPMKSIPSFFNHIYEMRNHLPVHSERAPVDEWIKWRDAYLATEIAEYKKFIFYWMDRYSAENRLLITYEGLTDDVIGPEVTRSLNKFLGEGQGVTPIDDASVPCIWKAVVKNEPPSQQAEKFKALQEQAKNDPNAAEIQAQVAAQVGQQAVGGEAAAIPPQAPPVAQQAQPAVDTVQAALPEMPVSSSAALPSAPEMQQQTISQQQMPPEQTQFQQPVASQYQQMQPQTQFQQPAASQFQQVPPQTQLQQPQTQLQQPTQFQQPQTQFQQPQTQFQQPAVGLPPQQVFDQNTSPGTDDLEAQILAAQSALAQGQQLLSQQTPGLRKLADQNQHVLPPETQSIYQQPQLSQQQSIYQQQQLPDQTQFQQFQHRRRLDPGHHNSQRAGPEQPRPYTPQQLDDMMKMLLEVADKYNNTDDIRVYHIMMKYHEQIKEARAKLDGAPAPVPAGGFF